MQKQVTKSIIVKGKPSEVYPVWENFETFPSFMKYVKSVTKSGDGSSHWVVEIPGVGQVEWEAETTKLEANKRIGWSSKDVGELKSSGQATFTSLPEREQTQVTVTMQLFAETGPLAGGDSIDNLDQILEEELRNFKAYVEGMEDRLPKD